MISCSCKVYDTHNKLFFQICFLQSVKHRAHTRNFVPQYFFCFLLLLEGSLLQIHNNHMIDEYT